MIIILSAIILLQGFNTYRPGQQQPLIISWDVTLYYYYLPAYLIYDDPGVEGDWGLDLNNYHVAPGKPGKPVAGKMTMGLAYLYLPFFLVADLIAKNSDYVANGFSHPYHMALLFGGYLSLIMGMVFLRKVLLRSFGEWVTALTMALTLFATNLWVFSVWKGANPHVWTFALGALLFWLYYRFKEKGRISTLFWMSLIAGEITLIRPTNIIIILIPFLLLFLEKGRHEKAGSLVKWLLPLSLVFVAPSIPQLFHWHHLTGDWIHYSYGEEGFFWTDPKFAQGLFSFRKGWFIYSPGALFIIPGMIQLYHQDRKTFHILLWPLLLGIYVMVSWWCWWYGGSFGMRPMIDWLPFLALPMGSGIKWMLDRSKWFTFILSSLMIYHTWFTSNLFIKGILHYDSMTFKSLVLLYKNPYYTEKYNESLCHPDYQKALRGMRKPKCLDR